MRSHNPHDRERQCYRCDYTWREPIGGEYRTCPRCSGGDDR